MVSQNIGTLWFGIGKVKEKELDGLDFVIMIAIAKVDNELKVYRYRKEGKRGIMPKDMVIYYNQIDIGIFLYFLELCLEKNSISYHKELYVEENHENENNLVAVYKIKTA